jgi:hypothetical protein
MNNLLKDLIAGQMKFSSNVSFYRVIQEEISVFCEKEKPHEHVSNSEWLWTYSCLNLQMTNLLRFTINVQKSHKQDTVFEHEFQSAFRLMVGFLNIYCE